MAVTGDLGLMHAVVGHGVVYLSVAAASSAAQRTVA